MEIQEQPVMQATEEMDNLLWPQESEAAVEALQPQATEVRAEVEALMVPEAAVVSYRNCKSLFRFRKCSVIGI